MTNLDTSVIPRGDSCVVERDGKKYICPYWSIDETRRQGRNGYCVYLRVGDWMGEKYGSMSLWSCVKECGIKE